MIGIAGIVVILGIAVLLSSDRRAIRLRVVGAAFALQVGIAVLVLYAPWGRSVLAFLSGGVADLLSYAKAGTDFLFGPLATPAIGGNSFAIAALPVIIFFASLVSILYYLGVMQLVVRWIGGGIEKVIGVSKVESLCAAANIFVGQSESPLVIRPYLAGLTPPQLFTVMTSGMAGVAGTILAAYASMGISIEYLLAASFMAAPGGILMAKIIMPDARVPVQGELPLGDVHAHDVHLAEARISGVGPAALLPEGTPGEPLPDATHDEERPANLIMAAAQGAQTGVKLAVAVGAMVLAFVALVALANGLLGGFGNIIGLTGLSFQGLLGYVFSPVLFLLNVPWREAGIAGGLFGQKIVLNEFVAYISLGQQAAALSPRTVAIVTFALCGFANFSSIAIQMAVTGSLAPNQRPMIAKLGIRALVAGSLANLMSAALAGLLIG
nr:NupC/NupG family nucleoside CNT transporter [Sphingomonas sp. BT552]